MNFLSHPNLSGKFFIIFLIMSLFVSGGCASIYNPLAPRWNKSTNEIMDLCKIKITPEDYPYQKGVHCAGLVRDAYLEAGVDDVTLSDKFALALIPLGMAAIGVGVAGVDGGNTITGLALGSGALLGWGTWMTSSTRRELYGLGAKALSCVISASEPLYISKTRADAIKTKREELSNAIVPLTQSIGRLKDNFGGNPDLKTAVEERISSANNTLSEGNEALKSADLTIDTLSRAGQIVWDATMEIHSVLVSAQIKNANDLHNYSDFLQGTVYGNFQDLIGLASISTPFGGKKDTGEKQSLSDADRQSYANLIENLEKNQRNVVEKIVRLNADLQAVTVVNLNSRFVSCMDPLKSFQRARDLLVSPRIIQMNPDQQRQIKISGGIAPYSVFGTWENSVDLTIQPTALQSPGVATIKSGSKGSVTPKTYQLFVEDADGRSKIVRIIFTETSVTGNTNSNKKDDEKPEDVIKKALNESENFKPQSWRGAATGAEWDHHDSELKFGKHLFSFPLKDPEKVDVAKKAALKRFKGEDAFFEVTVNTDINPNTVELRMKKDQVNNVIQAIRGNGNKWPIEPPAVIKQIAKIEEALNDSPDVGPSGWGGVKKNGEKRSAWKGSDEENQDSITFSLQFESSEEAEAAKDNVEKHTQIRSLLGNNQKITIKNEDDKLQILVPSTEMEELLKSIPSSSQGGQDSSPSTEENHDKIIQALNTCPDAQPDQWENVLVPKNSHPAWKITNEDSSGKLKLYLAFSDPDDAGLAKQNEEKTSKLKACLGNNSNIELNAIESDLQIAIPDSEILNIIETFN